jgi:hypothetical protein
MTDWAITVPKTTKWEDYQEELDVVSDYSHTINYHIPHFPRDMQIGDRCFIVWNGKVRGWMEIVDLQEIDAWTCNTTGRQWPAGRYIVRSGPFHPVDGPEMQGFRGIRKFNSVGIHV